MLLKKILLVTFCMMAAGGAWAGGMESLEAFVKNAKSGRADFSQTVTAPPKEGQPSRAKVSSGTFEFQRPGKFKFDYKKPFAQSIVADGETLWLYDADLNQVTQRKQSQALGSTPAALIASAPDLRALQADFTLEGTPERDGLQWVKATPKNKDGQLQNVQIGFQGDALASLEILDSFGQRSVLKFSKVEVNPLLPASTFQFKAPAGADVIRQ
ncbi:MULTISPECIES: outer membrane lipoprotein chaperone LolA [unclassified Variovorax]|uniref:outer membrane lipoprotein chaperone LolA n=1 Tax=unclassified Variovorax TaxID=663243 RepID=UPI00076CD468|nr:MULTISPECIES: outer membrane lipoprotein chaperone LolA [unclassified Variovorax]KWT79164.1 Outer membrane lipoprotein carrier protein LolA [Variovorax sp. WDL1]PNG55473.1 Outer-membrane lipoprotein carrier protein [Variovorax sp. B4]PNG56897.1 Outer-membrane lipoprotein carrier protein [Variovorax sp. B2]VTV10835.1 Outer-membrane lipoprotein carrier protein precursor [Variovorax sp. WDL1]